MPLTNEQSRQMIDAGHIHDGLRAAQREFRQSYRYAARWRKVTGREYLYVGEASQGPRTPDAEARFAAYNERRDELQARIATLRARLDQMAPVNRALRLGRVPTLPARLIRALDAEGLLGGGIIVIGTYCMFAYEAATGDYFDAGLIATRDLDLCWDARERLEILTDDGRRDTIISVLKRVDRSFDARAHYGLRAVNDENFIVDLMSPADKVPEPATGIEGDLAAAPVPEVAPLLCGRPFSAMAMGEDGLPVRIVCPQSEAFVEHKRLISAEASGRPAMQRRRDAAQADAVAAIVPVLAAARAHYTEPDG